MANKSVEANSAILFIYDARLANPDPDPAGQNKPRIDDANGALVVSDARLKQIISTYPGYRDIQAVQFTWGYSLNPVTLYESEGEGDSPKDYRIAYGLMAFSGAIHGRDAKEKEFSTHDAAWLDNAMVKALPAFSGPYGAGQTPRLYLRVEMKDSGTVLKDLREYIKLDTGEGSPRAARSIHDIGLDVDALTDYLRRHEQDIAKVYYWLDDQFKVTGFPQFKAFFKRQLEAL